MSDAKELLLKAYEETQNTTAYGFDLISYAPFFSNDSRLNIVFYYL
jgi:hypothetical protein